MVEIQAFGTSAGGEKVQWLVPDHLGTPRIILDQTGDMANVKRHDYLPFGEEPFAGTGGRTSALGYTGGDGVRQQFTLKERDIETGLDYFLARYYSSAQGRFTSPDAPFLDQSESSPQSWNLYTYVRNNPLRLVDPTGNSAQEICNAICQESKKKAEEARKKAEAAGIDVAVINSKPAHEVVEVTLVSEPLTALEELDERMTGDFGRDIWIFGEFAGIYDPTFYLMPGRSTASGIILNSSKAGVSATGAQNAGRLLWGTWGSYPRVIYNGREYAEIGGRLYTYHAVERMMPRGLTTLGRSVSPNFVETVIQNGAQSQRVVDGVLRTAHTFGSVSVITEQNASIVITVITH